MAGYSYLRAWIGLSRAAFTAGKMPARTPTTTLKLNATAEMIPVTWPEFGKLHPFAPADQTKGYAELLGQLERWLAEITGFAGISLQPNAGSQGEYAGLLVIRAFHESRGDAHRHRRSGGRRRPPT